MTAPLPEPHPRHRAPTGRPPPPRPERGGGPPPPQTPPPPPPPPPPQGPPGGRGAAPRRLGAAAVAGVGFFALVGSPVAAATWSRRPAGATVTSAAVTG